MMRQSDPHANQPIGNEPVINRDQLDKTKLTFPLEIRIYRKQADLPTLSGFFDSRGAIADELENKAEEIRPADAVWATINEIDPEAVEVTNKLKTLGSGEGTSATKVARYKTLLIDIDPERPRGTSATDEEKAKAEQLARQVRGWLQQEHDVDSDFVDSGNGYHLRVAIDEPKENRLVIKRILQALAAKFDTADAKVDRSVYDPPRIAKLPGSWARKGEHAAERPHRMARVLELAVSDEPVPTSTLRAIAELAPAQNTPTDDAGDDRRAVERTKRYVARLLKAKGLRHRWKPAQTEKGPGWVVEIFDCPLCRNNLDAHGKPHKPDWAPHIMILGNGAPSYGCHHNRCQGDNWQTFKATFDPPIVEATDLELAHRYSLEYVDRLAYVPEEKQWYIRDENNRLRLDRTSQHKHLAKQLVVELKDEILANAGNDRDKIKRAWTAVRRIQSANKINNVLDLAKCEPGLAVSRLDFDADPLELGCPNGILDLATGNFRPYSADDYLARSMGAEFDPAAKANEWREFIRHVLPDADVRRLVQQLVGIALVGEVTEHYMPFLHGTGKNGKSVFVDTISAMFGDYGWDLPTQALMRKWDATMPPHQIAELCGRRWVFGVETGVGDRLDEQTVKMLTGGDRLQGAVKYGHPFTFDPAFTLFVAGNHLPRVRGSDLSIWRRMLLIPFPTTIPEEKRDPRLAIKLKKELPGVLNWALDGLRDYQQQGLVIPETVRDHTDEYRQDEDDLQPFIDEECIEDPQAVTALGDLYERYEDWAIRRRWRRLWTDRRFSGELRARGFEKVRRSVVHYKGIKLKPAGSHLTFGCSDAASESAHDETNT